MQYIARYESPLGPMLLAADDAGLTGAWFAGQKYFAQGLAQQPAEKQTPPLQAARRWLDAYFAGQEPDVAVPLHLAGTPFQTEVWQLLRAIPYGQTVTYGELAARLAAQRGVPRMSARAVGGAVGRNPVSLLVPCHRVVGAGGRLTGYAGGLERKRYLLALEQARERER